MSASQREQIRDSLRSSTRQQREASIRESQRHGKRRHSESAVTLSNQNETTVPPPRKQGVHIENDDDDTDLNDTDLNDSITNIVYSNEDALRDVTEYPP